MAKPAKGIFAKLRRAPAEPIPEPELGPQKLAALRLRAAVAEDPDLAAARVDEVQALAPASQDIDLQPVALVRAARHAGTDWTDAASWFGGLPKLGAIAWPTGSDGAPLPFAAQIALADIASTHAGGQALSGGSLAFFLGDGAVIHVPEGVSQPSAAPADLAPAYDEGGRTFPKGETLLSRAVFPFWPVEPILPSQAGQPPRGPFHAAGMPAGAWDGPVPVWWHGVDHLIAQLGLVLDRAGEDTSEGQRDGLSALVGALDGFAAERDPWAQLSSEEREVFAEALDNAWQQFGGLLDGPVPRTIEDLATLSLRAMTTGDAEAFAALPAPVREVINGDYRQPVGGLPRMFERDEHSGGVLLLELPEDDMMEWRFGGAFQFRISPGDLAERRWDTAVMTFEAR